MYGIFVGVIVARELSAVAEERHSSNRFHTFLHALGYKQKSY